jgi:hypothetical protein
VTENNEERTSGQGRDGSSRPAWKRDASESAGRPPRTERSSRDGDKPRRDGDRPRRDGDLPARDGYSGGRDSGPREFRGGARSNGPRQERPGRAGDGRETERPVWQQRVDRERDPNRPKSPMIPEEITEKDLDLLVRVQMKTLSPENAERVARHLAMVNLLINDDPELAHQHAIAAAERAGRIGVVRETLALTAYTIGDFALALREMQAYRRISGSNDQIPIMVDCERGLGRPEKALELGRSVDRSALEAGVRVNLAIALSGARLDLGENQLALAELEIAELNPERVFDYSPQLFRAYADTLEVLDRMDEAKRWWKLAERADEALAAKSAPAVEVQNIVEEIVIPEPYESRREDRQTGEDRPRWGDRAGRGDRGDRGDRPGWAPRSGGDRPRSDRPRTDRPRDDRPRDDRPRDERPRPERTADEGPRLDFGDKPKRSSGDRPDWKKKRD